MYWYCSAKLGQVLNQNGVYVHVQKHVFKVRQSFGVLVVAGLLGVDTNMWLCVTALLATKLSVQAPLHLLHCSRETSVRDILC